MMSADTNSLSFKRARTEREPSSDPNIDAVVSAAASTLEIVADKVAGVNHAVLRAATSQIAASKDAAAAAVQHSIDASVVAATIAQQLVTKDAVLQRAWLEVDQLKAKVSTKSELLRAGLSHVAADASRAAQSTSLSRAASATLSAEVGVLRQANQSFTATMQSAHNAFSEQLNALRGKVRSLELQVADKSVTAARMATALNVANQKLASQHEETTRMIDVVESLASHTKGNAGELERSRRLIRLLERQLDLQGIIAAVVPEDFASSVVATRGTVASTAAPSSAIKEVSPSFFALRLLEHRDVSIAELVDDWQLQTSRARELSQQFALKTEEYERLHRDASRTHLLYMEERRRRETEERRVGELQRQRVTAASAAQQLDALRLEMSTTMDSNAMLTVQLRQTREELSELQSKYTAAITTVAQLQEDARSNPVSQALARLKLHYEREVKRLHDLCAESEVARGRSDALVSALRHALQQLEASHDQQTAAYRASLTALQKSEALVVSLRSSLADATGRLAENNSAVATKLFHASSEVATATSLSSSTASQQSQRVVDTMSAMLSKLGSVFDHRQKLTSAKRSNPSAEPTGVDTTPHPENTITRLQDDSVIAAQRDCLRAAMTYTTVQLEATNHARNFFVDAQLSDAQCVDALYSKWRAALEERDRALADLKLAQEFIEMNGLRAVEQVLMHEVKGSGDDSATSPQRRRAGGLFESATQEELDLVKTQLREQTAASEALKETLVSREKDIVSLQTDLARSKATAAASERAAERWRRTLDAERDALKQLAMALVETRQSFLQHVQCDVKTQKEQLSSLLGIDESSVAPAPVERSSSAASAARERSRTSTETVHAADREDESCGDEENDDVPLRDESRTEKEEIDREDEEEPDRSSPLLNSNRDDVEADGSADDIVIPSAVLVARTSLQEAETDDANSTRAPVALPKRALHAVAFLQPLVNSIATSLTELRDAVLGSSHSTRGGVASNAHTIGGAIAAVVDSADNEEEHTSSDRVSRGVEVAVIDALQSDSGLSGIVSVVREIYEATGLLQRQRTQLRAADGDQEAATTNLMIDTLQRKCAALEDQQKAKEEVLQRTETAAALAAKAAEESMRRMQETVDAQKGVIKDRDTQCETLKNEVQQAKAVLAQQKAEAEKQLEMNKRLLEMVKKLSSQQQQQPQQGPPPAAVSAPGTPAASPSQPPTPSQ